MVQTRDHPAKASPGPIGPDPRSSTSRWRCRISTRLQPSRRRSRTPPTVQGVGGCMDHHKHVASRTIGKGSGPDSKTQPAWADCAYACWGRSDARRPCPCGGSLLEGGLVPATAPRIRTVSAPAGWRLRVGSPTSQSAPKSSTDEERPRSRSRTSSNRQHSTGRTPADPLRMRRRHREPLAHRASATLAVQANCRTAGTAPCSPVEYASAGLRQKSSLPCRAEPMLRRRPPAEWLAASVPSAASAGGRASCPTSSRRWGGSRRSWPRASIGKSTPSSWPCDPAIPSAFAAEARPDPAARPDDPVMDGFHLGCQLDQFG